MFQTNQKSLTNDELRLELLETRDDLLSQLSAIKGTLAELMKRFAMPDGQQDFDEVEGLIRDYLSIAASISGFDLMVSIVETNPNEETLSELGSIIERVFSL